MLAASGWWIAYLPSLMVRRQGRVERRIAPACPAVQTLAYLKSHKLSGTGHPERDAYASLVRWNTPKVRTYWKDRQIAKLGSEFNNGRIRTYTNTIGEQLILELFKKCETLEKAANGSLILLYEADAVTASNDGLEKLRIAAVMLAGVRRVLRDFLREIIAAA